MVCYHAQQSVEEFKRARERKDDVLFRDAAEKGWNAVVLATNYLIEKEIHKKVRSNKERRERLFELQNTNGKTTRYKFYERFMARAHFLHMQCFYDGIYTENEIEWNLKKVKSYVDDVGKVVK